MLYVDDFQISNPLGNKCKKYKLTTFYYTLGYPCFQSQLKHIFLLSLLRASYFKQYRSAILRRLTDELDVLENVGISVTHGEEVLSIKGRVTFVAADNLGVHNLPGFTDYFHRSKQICRYCFATTDEIYSKFSALDFHPRTRDWYDRNIEHLQQSGFSAKDCHASGINVSCELSRLHSFHVIDSFPPDIAHDIFEGVGPHVVSCVIEACIQKKYVTLAEVNTAIETFQYSRLDRVNKPQHLRASGSKIVVKQTAAECASLLNLLPLLIGHRIPQHCEQWGILVRFVSLVRTFCAWTIPRESLPEVQFDIESWLEDFHRVFPEARITPKFHYLIHYTEQIEKHGCLTHCKTLRFENKHQQLKQLASRSKNHINICKTIAVKHQRALCSNLKSRACFSNKTEFVYGDAKDKEALIPPMFHTCVKPTVNGTEYVVGDVVFYRDVSSGPVLLAMVVIILSGRDDVHFSCRRLVVQRFCNHVMAFEVTVGSCVVISVSDLADFEPASMYRRSNKYLPSARFSRGRQIGNLADPA